MIIKSSKHQTVLDCLKEYNFSRKVIRGLKFVYVNNLEVRLWQYVEENDLLDVPIKEEISDVTPTKGSIVILYEDEFILIVNKPNKMSSQPNIGHYTDSLANYIKYYFEEKNINSTIHLVNRLDYETSGLVLVAKSSYIHNLFKKVDIIKKYYAVVSGIVEDDGLIEAPIIRDGKYRVIGGNKMAITEYKVIRSNINTLLDIRLYTGRTHQIRVHMKSINHPVVGDNLYGSGDNLMLESYYLEFKHPINNELIKVELDLDKRLDEVI
jgi:23S rRNA pseudouridine1911/1915/1917 synthase